MSEIVEADREVADEIELADEERRVAEGTPGGRNRSAKHVPWYRLAGQGAPGCLPGSLYFVSAYSLVSALLPWIRNRDDTVRTIIEVIAVPAIPSIAWAACWPSASSGSGRRKRVAFRTL